MLTAFLNDCLFVARSISVPYAYQCCAFVGCDSVTSSSDENDGKKSTGGNTVSEPPAQNSLCFVLANIKLMEILHCKCIPWFSRNRAIYQHVFRTSVHFECMSVKHGLIFNRPKFWTTVHCSNIKLIFIHSKLQISLSLLFFGDISYIIVLF